MGQYKPGRRRGNMEEVIIRQDRDFRLEARARAQEGEGEMQQVGSLGDLSPYGMLLSALGSCTTVVLHTYAQHHGIDLSQAEVHLRYERDFKEDCDNCEEIDRYEDRIRVHVGLEGNLSREEREKLERISELCSIHKILEDGIEIMGGE
jgi:putative redox protein